MPEGRLAGLRPALVIARREFLERVRSKWFVAMTILWPVLMVGMIVVPALLGGRGTAGAKVQIIDYSGALGQALQVELAKSESDDGLGWQITLAPPETTEKTLQNLIQLNELNGYVVVARDVLDTGTIIYYGDNASNQTVQIRLQKAGARVLTQTRAQHAGVTADQLIALLKRIDVRAQHTTGEEAGRSALMVSLVGYFLAFLVYVAITLYGIGVMRSIVTEKSNRVVELLVAATKPNAMMTGKILGVGAAGLAQIGIWFVLGALALANQDTMLHWFHAKGGQSLGLPSLTTIQLGVTLLCFALGYIFYSALYAAVGAMVGSEQDSQQAQMPVTFLLLIGMVAITAVTNDPRSSAAEVLTMVPFWSPMLMPVRYFMDGASTNQVMLSLAILAASTYLVARVAAKIYRVGILMYGKRPTVRELVRWLRY